MSEYLGETPVLNFIDTPFDGWGPAEWARHYAMHYGGIDGANHKMWVIDQIIRILHGTKVHVKLASWSDGSTEYRFNTGEPSTDYKNFVFESIEAGYEVDKGIPP